MRTKQRYILVETSKEVHDKHVFTERLYGSIIEIVGQLGYHKINPKVIDFASDDLFIIKADLSGVEELIRALTFLKRVDNADIAFFTLRSSGTLRALRAHMRVLA
jgi:RNase P/RNase MRP subunit POP5